MNEAELEYEQERIIFEWRCNVGIRAGLRIMIEDRISNPPGASQHEKLQARIKAIVTLLGNEVYKNSDRRMELSPAFALLGKLVLLLENDAFYALVPTVTDRITSRVEATEVDEYEAFFGALADAAKHRFEMFAQIPDQWVEAIVSSIVTATAKGALLTNSVVLKFLRSDKISTAFLTGQLELVDGTRPSKESRVTEDGRKVIMAVLWHALSKRLVPDQVSYVEALRRLAGTTEQ